MAKSKLDPRSVVITAITANTSLGNAVGSAAAARAGLNRARALATEAFDPEDGPTPIIGHPVATVCGFQGEARLLALAFPALKELVARAELPREKLGLLLALPDLVQRAKTARVDRTASISIPNKLTAWTGIAVAQERQQAISTGPTAFASALSDALEMLAGRSVQACIVGAVDTLCDDLALDALAAQSRLKTGDNPVGLQPGEAACFMLLEAREDADRRGRSALARIVGVGRSQDSKTVDDPPDGSGLAQAIAKSAAPPPSDLWFVLDRNGEVRRAHDWARCLLRVISEAPEFESAPEWDPALSFGDTGAASGALGIVLAVQGYRRNYAPRRAALVLSSGDDGARAAVCVERAE